MWSRIMRGYPSRDIAVSDLLSPGTRINSVLTNELHSRAQSEATAIYVQAAMSTVRFRCYRFACDYIGCIDDFSSFDHQFSSVGSSSLL